ncbi:MAG TPA: hypothetical protein VJK66_06175 [Gaiellaceae bacterium]|nr:hypothetical protein [Gaiellaceae bacterium]
MPRAQIHSKVGGATAAGALALVVVWLLQSAGYTIPPDVQGAITVLFGFAGGWLASS